MDKLLQVLSYRLDIPALCAGMLVSLCASLLGVVLILKRRPLFGGGVGGVGFTTAALSFALGLPAMYISAPAVLCAAFLLTLAGRKSAAAGDTAAGATAASAFSAGVIIAALSGGFSEGLLGFAFGDLHAMTGAGTLISAALAVVLLILFMTLKNRVFFLLLDETYASACGVSAARFRFLTAAATAVVVLIGMRSLGALMLPSLIIFPAMTAVRLERGFKRMLAAAGLISVFCFICGALISITLEVPTGAAAACVNAAVLLLAALLRRGNGDNAIFL